MEKTISCCLMSWRSHKTLAATLETYKAQNLFSYFDEVVVLFQEMSSADLDLATQYQLKYISTEKNFGIYGGMRLLAECASSDYVLMLENDCPLIEGRQEIERQLKLARSRLENREVDAYRLRSRWQPGEKFDTVDKFKEYHLLPGETFNLKKMMLRFLRPNKFKKLIGTAPYVHENPQGPLYEKYIKKMPEGDFIVDSEVLPWTNQSVLVNRKWFLDVILLYVAEHPSRRTVGGFQDVEKSLNAKWWRRQHFKIGIGKGLFTHKRLDR